MAKKNIQKSCFIVLSAVSVGSSLELVYSLEVELLMGRTAGKPLFFIKAAKVR